jgi:hypothetical protein
MSSTPDAGATGTGTGIRGARLRVWFGEQWIGEWALVRGRTLRLGRGKECDVWLPDPRASREHLEIRFVAGGWEAVDLGSTGGTACNGVPIQRQRLRSGDQLTLGDCLVLAADLEVAVAPASSAGKLVRLALVAAACGAGIAGLGAWWLLGGGRGVRGDRADRADRVTTGERPAVDATAIGTAGGTIEREGGRLEIPAAALARDQAVEFRAAQAPPPLTYEAAGTAFTLNAGQAWFAKPLRVTLPIDPARLPAGTKPEQVYAVFAQDGLGERLEGGVVDLTAGTVTVELDHGWPMVSAQLTSAPAGSPGSAPAPAGGQPPVLQAALGPELGIVLSTPQAIYLAPATLENRHEVVEEVRRVLHLVRERYRDIEIDPAPLRVEVAVMNQSVGAFVSGYYQVTVNQAQWSTRQRGDLSDPASLLSRTKQLLHEYFHLVQNRYVRRNVRRAGTAVPADFRARGQADWLWEATATWMEGHLMPGGADSNLWFLRRTFCYQPLHRYDVVSVDPNVQNPYQPHQYAAFIFFSYLDSLYAGRHVVLSLWSEYASGDWVADTIENDALRGRGTFNPLTLLDHYLQATPDLLGRRRNLREVYADFLLSFNWKKDFPPLASGGRSGELGGFDELVLPGRIIPWTLPFADGDKLGLRREHQTSVEGFQIAGAYHLTNQLDAKAGQRGDLEVRLAVQHNAPPEESLLVVFPYREGTRAPLIGNSQNPIRLENWQDWIGAVIWSVDLSLNGSWPLKVTAELKPAKLEDPAATADGPKLGPQVCTFLERKETRWEEMESGSWKPTFKPTAIELTNVDSGRTLSVAFTRPPETLRIGQDVPFEVTCSAAGGFSEQGSIGTHWQTTLATGTTEFVDFGGHGPSCEADSNSMNRRAEETLRFSGPSPGTPPGRRELVKMRVKAVVGSDYYYVFLGWWYDCK